MASKPPSTVYPEGIFTRVVRANRRLCSRARVSSRPSARRSSTVRVLSRRSISAPSWIWHSHPHYLPHPLTNCVLVRLVLAQGRSPLACLVSLTLSASACLAASSFLRCNSFSSTSRIRTLALLTFAAGCSISRSRVKTVFTF